MSETIDELTVAYEEDGLEVTKELDKSVLSKGSWTTIAYLYQDWDNKTEAYGKVKITLRRYQKVQGRYRQKSKFNVSSLKQARAINELLTGWLAEHDA